LKIFKPVLLPIHYLFSFVLLVIFKLFKFKFLNISTDAIGHQCIDIECFSEEIKIKKFNFKAILLSHEKYVANSHFFYFYQIHKLKDVIFIKNRFLCLFLKTFQRYEFLNYDCKKYTSKDSKKALSYEILKNYDFNFQIKMSTKDYAIKILRKYKIDLPDNIVLLHIRDQSFRPDDEERYRDSNINNYKKIINLLYKKNYNVIRIGNYGMQKADLNCLDITNLKMDKKEKEILDIYLISKCKFFIGTCSGLYCLVSLFGKPTITFDIAPLSFTFPHGKIGMGIPKKYFSIKDNTYLKFSDIFEKKYSDFRLDYQYQMHNLKTINNNENEIVDAVFEFIDLLKSTNSTNIKYNDELQNKFYSFMNDNCYSKNLRTTISSTYLKNNKELL
jgi:putative glycosyltransferase (TIGR04372 family)